MRRTKETRLKDVFGYTVYKRTDTFYMPENERVKTVSYLVCNTNGTIINCFPTLALLKTYVKNVLKN